jgi:hypothetical protein
VKGQLLFFVIDHKENKALFEDFDKPKKRQLFEKKLTELVLQRKLVGRYEIYLYGLGEGFLLKDVNAVLKQLKTDKKIDFNFKLISSDLHKHKDDETLKIL